MEKNTFLNITDEEYFSAKGLNFSTLKNIMISPKHYKASLEESFEPTPSQELGTAIHKLILKPEEFINEYKRYPDGIDKRTKEYKELAKEGLKMCPEGIVTGVKTALEENKLASGLIDGAFTEVSIFFDEFKAKIDGYNQVSKSLFDVKTSSDISPRAFKLAIEKYKYYSQLAFYRRALLSTGAELDKVYIIAVSTAKPFDVAVYRITEEYLNLGDWEITLAIDKLYTCEFNNVWRGVQETEDAIIVNVPTWRLTNESE